MNLLAYLPVCTYQVPPHVSYLPKVVRYIDTLRHVVCVQCQVYVPDMLMYCGHIPHCTNITTRKVHVLHKIQYRYRYSMLPRYRFVAKVRYLPTLLLLIE